MKSAAQLIVHSALGHGAQRDQNHVAGFLIASGCPIAQQEIQHAGTREFGRSAESAQPRIERSPERVKGRIQRVLPYAGRLLAGSILRLAILPQLLDHLRAGLLDPGALFFPCASQAFQNRAESRAPITRIGREVGPSEKRFALGRHPYRHRPSPAAGGRLDEEHVHAIQIRPLFTIHFDRDEMFVQHASHVLVFEGLALHHVAPVTGGITDGEEYRLIFFAGFLARFLAPRIPIHGIVGVLQQVWTLLVDQSVGGHCFLLWQRSGLSQCVAALGDRRANDLRRMPAAREHILHQAAHGFVAALMENQNRRPCSAQRTAQ